MKRRFSFCFLHFCSTFAASSTTVTVSNFSPYVKIWFFFFHAEELNYEKPETKQPALCDMLRHFQGLYSHRPYCKKKNLEEHIANAKKTWKGINELINRQKKKQKDLFPLKCPRSNHLSNDPTEISNIFNKFFLSVGHSLSSKMPKASTQFTAYLPRLSDPGSFFFCLVTCKEIEEEIIIIPSNKTFGLYSVDGTYSHLKTS